MGLPKELAVQGKLFADVGTIGHTDIGDANKFINSNGQPVVIVQSSAPRASIGTGVVMAFADGADQYRFGFAGRQAEA